MNTITCTPYKNLQLGQIASYVRTVKEADVLAFSSISGDYNPIHLDPVFASKTIFRNRIVHGMFTGALISAAVSCKLPGPGTIYLAQNLIFNKPAKINDTLTVYLKILEKLPKFKVRISTCVHNQEGDILVEGEAKIIAPRR